MLPRRAVQQPTQWIHRAQDLQYVVFWFIVGPFLLVSSLYLAGGALLSIAGPNSESLATGLGSVLFYCSWFGALLTAHAFGLFGLLGLLVLPWFLVRRRALTLGVCIAALCMAAPLLAAVYFNYN